MFRFKRKQPKWEATFIPNYFTRCNGWIPVRCVGCGAKGFSALNVNGTCVASCGGVSCNLQAIATAGSK